MSIVNVLFDGRVFGCYTAPADSKCRCNFAVTEERFYQVTIVSLVEGSLNLHIKVFRLDQA